MILVKRCWAYSKRQIALIALLALIFLILIILVGGKNTDIAKRYLITDVVSPNILFAVTGLFSNFIISIFQYKSEYFSLIRAGKNKLFEEFISWEILSVINMAFLVTVFYQVSLWIEWRSISFYLSSFIWSWLKSSTLVLIIELIVVLISIVFMRMNILYLGSFVFISLAISTSTAKGMQILKDTSGMGYLMHRQFNLTLSYFLVAGGIIILLILLEKYLFKLKEVR